ncbi:VirK family protein [Pseudomonas sp. CDFA 602]|uniref:VirK family protein n=1 Tax=Pseudomonas californiensis TaxID=2829823 RepID=UPI001E4E67F8|nr:VirK family protein [Pseudomonas californiensis]MCD5994229.1 VirK family protein [Pseudomonas californiensis]MCD5999672.1 VirK family protein [Pseudomonas californiensis]
MKRYCAALLALSLPALANAGDALTSFPAITQALNTGESVSVVIDLGQCKSSIAGAEPSRTQGGKRIDAYRITPDGTLAFSDTHFSLDRDNKPIEQFIRYRVRSDNTADFSMTTLSVPGYQQIGKAVSYDCAVGKGLSFFAS